MKYILIMALMVLTACATNKVKELDTEIDVKGSVSEGTVGLKDDVAIIQQKTAADDELRGVQWQNYDLESQLNHEQSMVQWCYTDLADPRLGGNEEVKEMPENSGMKPTVEVREELGLEGDKLVVVKTMDFREKIAAEKKYNTTLSTMLKQAKKTRETCERKMGYARNKAGLPSTRYQGRITITPQGTVDQVIAPHEHNLDDAFRIKKETSKSTSTVEERTPASSTESPTEE